MGQPAGSIAREEGKREYPHGTLASYCHGACRCAECRQANTLYHRELRKRLRERIGKPYAAVPHGTAGGYANHGCRCRACSEAHRQAMVASYAKRKARRAGPNQFSR